MTRRQRTNRVPEAEQPVQAAEAADENTHEVLAAAAGADDGTTAQVKTPDSELVTDVQDSSPTPILIDIDRAVSGGFIEGRFELQIFGRVASAASVDEVELIADGEPVSKVLFGQSDDAAAVVLPVGTGD